MLFRVLTALPRRAVCMLIAVTIVGSVLCCTDFDQGVCGAKALAAAPASGGKEAEKSADVVSFTALHDMNTLDGWTAGGGTKGLVLQADGKGGKAIAFTKTGAKEDWVRASLDLGRPWDLYNYDRFHCRVYISDPASIEHISFWLGEHRRWSGGYLLSPAGPWQKGWNSVSANLMEFARHGKRPGWRKIRYFSMEIRVKKPTQTTGKVLLGDVRLRRRRQNNVVKASGLEPKEAPYVKVDGRPFFPVGVYGMPHDAPDDEWREVASLGINLVTSDKLMLTIPQWRAFLDKAHKHGIKAAVGLIYPAKDVWNAWWATDLNEKTFRNVATPAQKKKFLRKIVNALKDHPALLCWDTVDEISQYGVAVEGLLAGYEFVKKLDPKHPVWLNHPSSVISKRKLVHYNQIADIISVDIYPVPVEGGWSNLPDKTISSVGAYTELMKESVGNRKPVWMVLQSYKLNPDECPTGRFPNLGEFRFMTYDAIVSGTKGLVYFMYLRRKAPMPRWTAPAIPYTPEFWVAMKSVLLEMKELQPALVSPDVRPGLKITSADGNVRSVKGLLKKVKSVSYLICINRSAKPAKGVLIGLPGERIGKSSVLFEGRWATVKGGKIVDDFEGYGVHVYCVGK